VKSITPRVTVVIPSYNAQETIRSALDSALAQGPHVDEVLVVDDGSDDGTASVVREYGHAVTLVSEPHRGDPAIPRNIGIQRASNDLIAFLDADDVWLPGKVDAQLAALVAEPGVGLVCTNAFRQTQPEVFCDLQPYLPRGAGASGDVLAQLLVDNFVITSSVLVLRAVVEDVGYFRNGSAGSEDYGLWLRAARVCRFVYLEQPWLTYRDFGWSYRQEWSRADGANSILENLNQLEERFPGTARMYRREFRKRRRELYAVMGRHSLSEGDRRGAVRSFSAALCQRPMDRRAWLHLLDAFVASDATGRLGG